MLRPTILVGAVVLALVGPASAQNAKRVALVIGNSDYQYPRRLANPRNDAADLAAAFRLLNFTVIVGLDLDKPRMERSIRDFAQALSGADLGVFFYAGHGLQVSGANYLVPIEAQLKTASALDFEMVRLDLVQRTMERESQTNVLFLDACRDNPLVRNLALAMGTRSGETSRGLAAMEAGVGTLISFSTQPGNTALDGQGRNSPYAGALAKHLLKKGEDLSSVLINVRNDVMKATASRQVPWEHTALRARLFLTEPISTEEAARRMVDAQFWAAVKDSSNWRSLQLYLDRFPNGQSSKTARLQIEKLKNAQASDQAAWSEAQKIGTVAAYQHYIGTHPSGQYATAAKQSIEDRLALTNANAVRDRFHRAVMDHAKRVVLGDPSMRGTSIGDHYNASPSPKALATCLNWDSVTPFYYSGWITVSTLKIRSTTDQSQHVTGVVDNCNLTAKEQKRNCTCVLVDVAGQNALQVPDEWAKRFVYASSR